MKTPVFSEAELYTYADYLQWDIAYKNELMDGRLLQSRQMPGTYHQTIVANLCGVFHPHVKQAYRHFTFPFTVRLPSGGSDIETFICNVVQPDYCIVDKPDMLDRKGYHGVPLLIAEVVQANTMNIDMNVRYNQYEMAGVPEYWIIMAEGKFINQYVLDDGGRYELRATITRQQQIVCAFDDRIVIDVEDLF